LDKLGFNQIIFGGLGGFGLKLIPWGKGRGKVGELKAIKFSN